MVGKELEFPNPIRLSRPLARAPKSLGESNTMPTNLTKVQTTKVLAIFEKLGLKVTKQPSQYRVEDATGTKRLYVPGTAKVHRIDLSGFTHELAVLWTDVYPGKKSPSGKITQVVNFAQDEKLVLRSIFKIAKSLVTVAAPAPAPVAEVTEAPAEAPALEQAAG